MFDFLYDICFKRYLNVIRKRKKYLKRFNLENEVIELSKSSVTVKEAASALGCNEGSIAKSLSFLIDETPILIICAADVKIDNAKF